MGFTVIVYCFDKTVNFLRHVVTDNVSDRMNDVNPNEAIFLFHNVFYLFKSPFSQICKRQRFVH